jgi:hypothetical protein
MLSNKVHTGIDTESIPTFGVFNYLNDADALDPAEEILQTVRWEWYTYQEQYRQATITPRNPGGITLDLVKAWDDWYLDVMETRLKDGRQWLISWCVDGMTHWQGRSEREAGTIVAILQLYLAGARALGGYNAGTYPRGTPNRHSEVGREYPG